jgi:hypothetical protein
MANMDVKSPFAERRHIKSPMEQAYQNINALFNNQIKSHLINDESGPISRDQQGVAVHEMRWTMDLPNSAEVLRGALETLFSYKANEPEVIPDPRAGESALYKAKDRYRVTMDEESALKFGERAEKYAAGFATVTNFNRALAAEDSHLPADFQLVPPNGNSLIVLAIVPTKKEALRIGEAIEDKWQITSTPVYVQEQNHYQLQIDLEDLGQFVPPKRVLAFGQQPAPGGSSKGF